MKSSVQFSPNRLPLRKNKESADKGLQETKTRVKKGKRSKQTPSPESSREGGYDNTSCSPGAPNWVVGKGKKSGTLFAPNLFFVLKLAACDEE